MFPSLSGLINSSLAINDQRDNAENDNHNSIDVASKKGITSEPIDRDMLVHGVRKQIEDLGHSTGLNTPEAQRDEARTKIKWEHLPEFDLDTVLNKRKPPEEVKDNIKTTGQTDRQNCSVSESLTEEKTGEVESVQSKVLGNVKTFVNYLYCAANAAGKALTEAGAKMKKTVEDSHILSQFNEEQEAFAKSSKGNAVSPRVLPWLGWLNEDGLKEQILSLSKYRRTFLSAPPAGVDFQFDYDVFCSFAMAVMERDPNLAKIRYDLVPKTISEENFWKNYFYRVSLICRANELFEKRTDSGDINAAQTENHAEDILPDVLAATFQDSVKIEEGAEDCEDWEKELEAELEDYGWSTKAPLD